MSVVDTISPFWCPYGLFSGAGTRIWRSGVRACVVGPSQVSLELEIQRGGGLFASTELICGAEIGFEAETAADK